MEEPDTPKTVSRRGEPQATLSAALGATGLLLYFGFALVSLPLALVAIVLGVRHYRKNPGSALVRTGLGIGLGTLVLVLLVVAVVFGYMVDLSDRS